MNELRLYSVAIGRTASFLVAAGDNAGAMAVASKVRDERGIAPSLVIKIEPALDRRPVYSEKSW